ncbi:MAG TPA: bile acid:sodium symporter, partial [Methylomirabilota bacterium]|nr:bile acid:sodium symporter [Methylomirabilota bacterium]
MQTTIKVLTVGSLTGLLFAVGLRLTWVEIRQALRQRGLAWVVIANFVAVPALAVLAVRAFALPREIAVAMLLLAAAPFAPAVPIFTKLSRGNLALAAGLTAVFPFLSALLTPLACVISFKAIPGSGYVEFSPGTILMVLFCTITLPLTFGAAVNHWLPAWRGVLLRPVEMISECAGAASLALVTVAELPSILGVGGRALLAMALLCEAWMVLGWMLGGNGPGSRA